MKKLVLFSVLTGMMINGLAEDGLSGTGEYTIVSDLRDHTIPPGKFEIQGVVKMNTTSQLPDNVQVGLLESSFRTNTDSSGHFSLLCDVVVSPVLYFYKAGWTEITIDNYDFKSQHRIIIHVNLEKESSNVIKRKPVIYCYAEQALTASVKLDPKGDFTFTYPAYRNGWRIILNPDGGVTDLNTGKNYPYLFWEAKSENLRYQTYGKTIPGFIINTDSTIHFLETTLTALGLNQTEQADFITFWGPILQKQPYALIQFLIDDVYETEIASLDISPKPDAIRRVYILCSSLNDMRVGMPVVPQELKSFERLGFTVVEWGGSEIDLTRLKPY